MTVDKKEPVLVSAGIGAASAQAPVQRLDGRRLVAPGGTDQKNAEALADPMVHALRAPARLRR